MNIFSIWRSTSNEIIHSKRTMGIIYGAVGIIILASMFHACIQFFSAYITLREFDVPSDAFIVISLFLFLPSWLVGALIIRACLQRIRLVLWMRNAARVVTYTSALTPAEAGFLVDYSYANREIVATLLDLHFRGIIHMSVKPRGEVTITQPSSDDALMSNYEYTLSGLIFESGTRTFQGFNDSRLIKAAEYAHETLIQELTLQKRIRMERLPNRNIQKVFRFLCVIAGVIFSIHLYALLTDPNSVFTVTYPRYSISFSQVLTLIGAMTVVLIVVISGFWPRLAKNHKDTDYTTWIDAAGLLMYIKAVFKDRFSESSIELQDVNSLHSYSAYAIAYGVIPCSTEMVSKILLATDPPTAKHS